MDITKNLQAQGITGYQLTLGSMESDELSLSFTRTPASAPLTFAVGDAYELGDFSGVVWDIDTEESAGAPTEVTVSVRGLIGVLETVPCVLLDGLSSVKSTTDKPELVTVGAVIAAAAKAAAAVGITIVQSGLADNRILMPFVGGTESVWSVLQNALRWVPCARTQCVGKTLYIESGETEAEEGDGGITYARRVQSSTRSSMDLLPPPVVAARGGQSFEFPSGASIYQPGAFVYNVPVNTNTTTPSSGGKGDVPGYGNAAYRDAMREINGQWMTVRGFKVPSGASTTPQRVGQGGGGGGDWVKFWQSFGVGAELAGASDFDMGTPFWHCTPVDVAYPPADDSAASGSALGPKLNDSGEPANYKDLGGSGMYVLTAGSFPASSDPRGNVSGLKFCKGSLTQYVWTTKPLSDPKLLDFFSGSCIVDGKPRRYTCFHMEAIFINRRSKRYQTGTNKDAPGDGDGGGSDAGSGSGDKGTAAVAEWTPDYHAALKAYYDATRRMETTESTVTLYGVSGFEPGVTTLRQAFAAAKLTGACGRVVYDAAARTLTLTNSRRSVLGVDDYIQRQEIGKRQAAADAANIPHNIYPAGLMPDSSGGGGEDDDDDKDDDEFPMVSPAVAAASSASRLPSQKIGPRSLFSVGDTWYLNAGAVAVGSKVVNIGITANQYKDSKPAGAWNSPESGKVKFKVYRKDGKLTFDLYQA